MKEESVEREGVGPDTRISSSASNIASTSTSAFTSASAPKTSKALPRTTELSKATPRSQRKASAKRTYVEIDDEESERDNASQQSDAEEYQAVSDDDDELLMGIEVSKTSGMTFDSVSIDSAPADQSQRSLRHETCSETNFVSEDNSPAYCS